MRSCFRLFEQEALELWSAPIRGRNGGVALALYDRAHDRHRWILWTRSIINATELVYGPSDAGLLLAFRWNRHPAYAYPGDGLLLLDLSRGTVREVRLPRPADAANSVHENEEDSYAVTATEAMQARGISFDGTGVTVAGARLTLEQLCAELRTACDVDSP